MPSLILRRLPPDLIERVRAYATSQGLGLHAGAVRLLTIALGHLDARQRGAKGKWAGTTPEQRRTMTERARQAALDARR